MWSMLSLTKLGTWESNFATKGCVADSLENPLNVYAFTQL